MGVHNHYKKPFFKTVVSKGFYRKNRQNWFFLVFLSKHHKNISKTYIWPWSLFGLWHTNPPTSVSVFYLFPAPSAKRQTPKQIDAPPTPTPTTAPAPTADPRNTIETPAYLYLASPFLYVWASPKKALYNNKNKSKTFYKTGGPCRPNLFISKKMLQGFIHFSAFRGVSRQGELKKHHIQMSQKNEG